MPSNFQLVSSPSGFTSDQHAPPASRLMIHPVPPALFCFPPSHHTRMCIIHLTSHLVTTTSSTSCKVRSNRPGTVTCDFEVERRYRTSKAHILRNAIMFLTCCFVEHCSPAGIAERSCAALPVLCYKYSMAEALHSSQFV